MRFERTDSFKSDYNGLSVDEKELFKTTVRQFNEASDRFVADPGSAWPASLRVKAVRGAPGVWEMTWSFAGPDGRATWEWSSVEVEALGADGNAVRDRYAAVRWRRIGNHRIFSTP